MKFKYKKVFLLLVADDVTVFAVIKSLKKVADEVAYKEIKRQV